MFWLDEGSGGFWVILRTIQKIPAFTRKPIRYQIRSALREAGKMPIIVVTIGP